MSKRGSPYLRRAIWLVATVAAFKDPALSRFYEKKRSEGKEHLTAIGHVCHKMLAIIFAVLCDNKPYVPASTSFLFIAGLKKIFFSLYEDAH